MFKSYVPYIVYPCRLVIKVEPFFISGIVSDVMSMPNVANNPVIIITLGNNGSFSHRIPRIPGSPWDTKDRNRSPNSETDPGTDLKHEEVNHVFLDIGPAIRIMQRNVEGISAAAKRDNRRTICNTHKIDIICLQEVHAKADNLDVITTTNLWHSRYRNMMG